MSLSASRRANPGKRHIVTSQVEHSSVLNYCMALEKTPRLGQEGWPDSAGVVTVHGGAVEPNGVRPRASGAGPYEGGVGVGPYRVTYLPVDRDGLLPAFSSLF